MRLNTAEVTRIADREGQNDARRDRDRERWAEAAAKREALAAAQRPTVVAKAVVPLGGGTELWIRNRIMFKHGPLFLMQPKGTKFSDVASLAAAAALRLQSHARAWPDGTMRGIKRLIWTGRAWKSPTMGTIWKEGRCSAAEDFDEDAQLRGHAGVHAVWPDKLDELPHYDGKLVEIAGWGQCTVGDLGWRAQHAKVVRELI